MNRDFERNYTRAGLNNTNFHSSVKPFVKEDFWEVNDSILPAFEMNKSRQFKVQLLSDTEFGFDGNQTTSELAYRIGAGAEFDYQLNSKLNINAKYLFNLYNGPSYLDSLTKNWGIAPSFGLTDSMGDGSMYHQIEGNIHYKASKHFTLQLGNGKNFIGDGYRSLLLSDVANNYPYFKITTKVWKIKYVNLFARQRHIYGVEDERSEHRGKFTTTHYLSWNVSKKISIGLFESIVWQAKDTLLNRGFDLNYINPIIFYRPVEFQQGSADNAIMGLNVSLDLGQQTKMYGQFMIDEFLLDEIKADSGWWANKYGAQIGVKSFNLAGVSGLDAQTEFNVVRPFTLSHGAVVQNYGHDNASLAHPYGANFWEWTSFVNYRMDKWRFSMQLNIAEHGEDSVSYLSYGGNIFQTYSNRRGDYNHELGQGVKTKILYTQLKASRLLSEKINLWGEVGYVYRRRKNAQAFEQNNYVYIGIKSNLWNRYTDY